MLHLIETRKFASFLKEGKVSTHINCFLAPINRFSKKRLESKWRLSFKCFELDLISAPSSSVMGAFSKQEKCFIVFYIFWSSSTFGQVFLIICTIVEIKTCLGFDYWSQILDNMMQIAIPSSQTSVKPKQQSVLSRGTF